jgi:hypothetical protein
VQATSPNLLVRLLGRFHESSPAAPDPGPATVGTSLDVTLCRAQPPARTASGGLGRTLGDHEDAQPGRRTRHAHRMPPPSLWFGDDFSGVTPGAASASHPVHQLSPIDWPLERRCSQS